MARTGIRATSLTNFKGDPYLTRPDLEDIIGGTVENLIDEETGNLNHTLNPIHITSMKHPTASADALAHEEPLDPEVGTNDQDFNNIKFIGNCEVKYGTDGKITIRIGDNVNSSLYNGTDGISNAVQKSAKFNDISATPSADFNNVSNADGSTQFQVFQGTDSIKIGTTEVKSENTVTNITAGAASTTEGLTDGTNGNEVHFNDNENGKFKVYIRNANDTNATEYVIGSITSNGTYYGKVNGAGDNVMGVKCTVTDFDVEPKSNKGATGYSGLVLIEIIPSEIYGSTSQAFSLVKIEMLEGNEVVGTWQNASPTAGTFFYMNETDKPGTPTFVDYTIDNPEYIWISGIKYLVDTTTATVTATGMSNIGYPALTNSNTDKVVVSPNSDNTWITTVHDKTTTGLTTWTDSKDATMTYQKSSLDILKGKFDDPQISVKGNNINGNGSEAVSAKQNNALLVSDENGFVTSAHGFITPSNPGQRFEFADGDYGVRSFDEEKTLNIGGAYNGTTTEVSVYDENDDFDHNDTVPAPAGEGMCNAPLLVYNGYIQYPAGNYTSYNKNGSTAVNRNYASLSYNGYRYYGCEILKQNYVGYVASGTLVITADKDPLPYIQDRKLVIGIYQQNIVDGNQDFVSGLSLYMGTEGIATSYGSWDATNKKRNINFEFKNSSHYIHQFELNNFILSNGYVRIMMTSNCDLKISNLELI